jgi:hypothetical protein
MVLAWSSSGESRLNIFEADVTRNRFNIAALKAG